MSEENLELNFDYPESYSSVEGSEKEEDESEGEMEEEKQEEEGEGEESEENNEKVEMTIYEFAELINRRIADLTKGEPTILDKDELKKIKGGNIYKVAQTEIRKVIDSGSKIFDIDYTLVRNYDNGKIRKLKISQLKFDIKHVGV